MMDLRQAARMLGGDVSGQGVVCPGPGHSPRDRSLSVTFSAGSPDGFIVFSHAGDDPIACRDHVRERLGLGAFEPRRSDRPAEPRRRPLERLAHAELREPAEAEKAARAARLWAQGIDPRGTLVEAYLASRGLTLPDDVAGEAIRFHPECPWRDDDTGEVVKVPAMLAPFRAIKGDEITGIHRTRLEPRTGAKIGRKMAGLARGAAVKLDADDAVTGGLTIGEGIETTLAARQLGFRPAWALGAVDAIRTFPVLAGIECLTLLAEDDKTGANAKAIAACGGRWVEAGREVLTVRSRAGGDINDAVRGAA